MASLNHIDIAILIITGYGLLAGIRAGLIVEITGLLALICGIAGARLFGSATSIWLQSVLGTEHFWIRPAAYLLVLIGISIGIRMIGRILTHTVELVSLGIVNKLLGGIFGGIKYILLFSIIFNTVNLLENHFQVPGKQLREESELYRPVSRIAPVLFAIFKDKSDTNNLFG